jgi:hypothetical protein
MPTYFQGSLAGLITPAGLTNPYSLTPGQTADGGQGNCCCPSSTKFLETLTSKLVDMTESLKKQFEDLQANCQKPSNYRGLTLVSIEVKGSATIKYEYIIYLQRYGPPTNGQFDPIYLDLIRAELAAGTIVP